MSILSDLSGATSAQGSQSTSSSSGFSNAQSQSGSDAESARAFSAQQANIAYQRQKELMQMEMEYNSREAQKERDYQTQMANSVYTRSVNNMKEAGINPILAANMGLSAAAVGSGATANVSGASAPMAQSFMDNWSASSSHSEQKGQSQGSSWGTSESGLATGLQLMGQAIAGALSTMNSGATINNIMSDLGSQAKTTWNDLKGMMIEHLPNEVSNLLGLKKEVKSSTIGKRNITGKASISGSVKQHSSGGGKRF